MAENTLDGEHLQRQIDAHEHARSVHEAAAALHKEAADFHEEHAAGERRFGRDDIAEEMEARADVAREREQAQAVRADEEQQHIEDLRGRRPSHG